jgi:UDP-3-O-acyl N-acetylglucosamine deacetylase
MTTDQMASLKQNTISAEFKMSGAGIHSGEKSEITVKPTDSGGIRFKRMDINGHPEIPARLDLVTGTDRGTNLGIGDVKIMTVEHIMSAFMGLEVDHVIVEIIGAELPIMDGSFLPFCEAITAVGLTGLPECAEVWSIQEPLSVDCSNGTTYNIFPSEHLEISAQIDFQHKFIGKQAGVFQVNTDTFISEIAPARTFGFKSEVGSLKKRGLSLGASLNNVIILDEEGVINGKLRFRDEFLRHKVGDMIGDLALIGKRIRANIICEKPGHEGNISLAKSFRNKVELNV